VQGAYIRREGIEVGVNSVVEVEDSDSEVIRQMGTWVEFRGGNGKSKFILGRVKGRGGHA